MHLCLGLWWTSPIVIASKAVKSDATLMDGSLGTFNHVVASFLTQITNCVEASGSNDDSIPMASTSSNLVHPLEHFCAQRLFPLDSGAQCKGGAEVIVTFEQHFTQTILSESLFVLVDKVLRGLENLVLRVQSGSHHQQLRNWSLRS